MGVDVERPTISAPDEWDRYFVVNVGLEPLVGTPGLPEVGYEELLETARGRFIQSARQGFFLTAAESMVLDPAEVSAGMARLPRTGDFAAICGTRRRQVRQTAMGVHAQFEQLVRGAPVVGADVRIHHDDDGVYAVTGRPIADLEQRDPGPAPAFDANQALETCTDRFELEGLPRSPRVRQVVFPVGDGSVWAYEVGFVVPEHAADVRALLRCDSYDLLVSYNVSAAAAGADIYRVNPRQTPTLDSVALQQLDAPGNLLRGAPLDVRPAAAARVDDPNGDFHLNPAQPEFDEPNAYHHLWCGLEYFKSIADAGLMAGAPFAPLVALVNDVQSPGNAYFFPSTGQLHCGLFGSRSSARSAALMYHELGHAVTDTICQLGQSFVKTDESRGLAEGYSDYFAASLLDDPRFGDFVGDKDDGIRNCSDAGLHFPDGWMGDLHVTGAVWAAVLWSIRQDLGAAVTDQLAIESVDFLGSSSTFEEARAALHSVDRRLNGSANQAVIDREFDARAPE